MKQYATVLLVSLLFQFGFCQQSGNYSMDEFCEELSDNLTKLCLPPYHDCPNPDFCKESEGENLALAFGLTIGAGFSTNIGALLSFLPCFKRSNVTLLAVGLALAAGFMVYIAFVDILGKTGEYFCCHTQTHYSLAATGCFFLGILLTLMLQYFLDSLQKLDIGCSPPWSKKKTSQEKKVIAEDDGTNYSKMFKSLKSKITGSSSQDVDTSSTKKEKIGGVSNPTKIVIESEVESESAGALKKLDDTLDSSEIVDVTDENEEKPDDTEEVVVTGEYDDVMELLGKDSKNLHRMGLFTAASIAIHNFPEGIATFIVGLATPILGVALAVAIALHNIPEGASVAIPIYYATGKKWKGLLWAFLSGISEPFGALMAFLIFKDIFGPLAYGFIFGFVGGMMVIVALKDLLPTARKFDNHGMVVTTFFILGMFVMAASLVFFEY